MLAGSASAVGGAAAELVCGLAAVPVASRHSSTSAAARLLTANLFLLGNNCDIAGYLWLRPVSYMPRTESRLTNLPVIPMDNSLGGLRDSCCGWPQTRTVAARPGVLPCSQLLLRLIAWQSSGTALLCQGYDGSSLIISAGFGCCSGSLFRYGNRRAAQLSPGHRQARPGPNRGNQATFPPAFWGRALTRCHNAR